MSSAELPPFPLTLFEKYFLSDTSDAFPMVISSAFHFSGCLAPEKFEESLRETLYQYPLFTRKIEKRKGTFYWVPTNETVTVRWLETPLDLSGKEWNEPIDVLRRNGLDVCVFHQGDETKVYFRCHHICTDGLGLYRFILDVFILYAQKNGVVVNVPTPIIPKRILDRNQIEPGKFPKKIGFFKIAYETLKEIFRWLWEKPVFIGTRRTTLQPRFGRKSYVASKDSTERWRKAAMKTNCTLNDLFIAAFFVLLGKHLIGAPRKGNRIRLMIPVNMRRLSSKTIPAANILSYVFLTKKKAECHVDRDFLLDIGNKMQAIKDWQVGFMFWDALRFFDRMPGGLRWLTSSKSCLTSMVFSNTGSLEGCFRNTFWNSGQGIFDVAGLRLERAESFAPCRHLTNLSAVANLQAGQLVLCCEYDRTYLSEEELDRMFNEYEMILDEFCRDNE